MFALIPFYLVTWLMVLHESTNRGLMKENGEKLDI